MNLFITLYSLACLNNTFNNISGLYCDKNSHAVHIKKSNIEKFEDVEYYKCKDFKVCYKTKHLGCLYTLSTHEQINDELICRRNYEL